MWFKRHRRRKEGPGGDWVEIPAQTRWIGGRPPDSPFRAGDIVRNVAEISATKGNLGVPTGTVGRVDEDEWGLGGVIVVFEISGEYVERLVNRDDLESAS